MYSNSVGDRDPRERSHTSGKLSTQREEESTQMERKAHITGKVAYPRIDPFIVT